jgi:hypothetical protein
MSDIGAKHVPGRGRGRVRVRAQDTLGWHAFRCTKCRWLMAVPAEGVGTDMRRALDTRCQCDGPVK